MIIDIELLRRKKLAAKKAALEKQKAEDSKKKKGKGKKKRAVKGISSTLSIFSVHNSSQNKNNTKTVVTFYRCKEV